MTDGTAEHTRGTPQLGVCARCDQPASVAITDAPGNVRCDVHAALIFAAEAEVHRLQEVSYELALDNAKLRASIVEDAGPVIVGLGQEIQAQRVDLERLREDMDMQRRVERINVDNALKERDEWADQATELRTQLGIWQQRFGDCQATVLRMEAVVSAAREVVSPNTLSRMSALFALSEALDAVPRRDGAGEAT